jgi:hypothetical protein
MAKSFIYQLRELKRFSTQDEKGLEGMEDLEENNLLNNMKRKVCKMTQTVYNYKMNVKKNGNLSGRALSVFKVLPN